jgi:hypothetical protein
LDDEQRRQLESWSRRGSGAHTRLRCVCDAFMGLGRSGVLVDEPAEPISSPHARGSKTRLRSGGQGVLVDAPAEPVAATNRALVFPRERDDLQQRDGRSQPERAVGRSRL